ncbi:MAG: hypothetical protein OSJ62_06480 [Lachnospiraceae bacterium]|nr:hypothetical protein [Lachnospiraceae bacterium]
MQKLGGAAIRMKRGEAEYLFGEKEIQVIPMIPFEAQVCEFLDRLSKALREDLEVKQYPDIMTFAFWIRKANILKLKALYQKKEVRVGKGLIFHIAPSNVPINFAYTFAFGLLSGNSNIVKVSSKRFIQTDLICKIMNQLILEEFDWVAKRNAIVLYKQEEVELTREFSYACDGRVIWGGDQTIAEIRKAPLQPRSVEITFADRYSFGIISAKAILDASDKERVILAKNFYNDTYLMDQNACSTPHLICWMGTEEEVEAAKELFWKEVYQKSKSYPLEEIKASEKYTIFCEMAANGVLSSWKRYDNFLYVGQLLELPKDICRLRGKFGLFYEYHLKNWKELSGRLGKKVQTCAIYGIESSEVSDWIVESHSMGVDRIVPFGKTLDIGLTWDGYDVIYTLSRCIAI